MSVDHMSKFIEQLGANPRNGSQFFNQRHSGSHEARFFENSRHRLPFVRITESRSQSFQFHYIEIKNTQLMPR